ncbi:intelectin-1 [Ciona intestinalis]
MAQLLLLIIVVGSCWECIADPQNNFYCGSTEVSGSNNNPTPTFTTRTVAVGPPGKRGPPGPPGNLTRCYCPRENELRRRVQELEEQVSGQQPRVRDCKQLKIRNPNATTGLYTIHDTSGIPYPVYCDMEADNGGWTLVASVHENYIGEGVGRCTVGDRWSSQQGNSPLRPEGDASWQNLNTFGRAVSATSDDYKSQAYFELQARDVMVWQVPNDTPSSEFSSEAYLKYRTTNGFLTRYGGNMFKLYSVHYPVISGVYTFPTDSGPSIPVVFDQGSATSLLSHLPTNAVPNLEAGYIQFRAISTHRDAFAFCPGVRNKPSFNSPSQSCIGSAGRIEHITYCGDFSGLYHDGFPVGTGWSGDNTLLKSSFLIFYR